MQKPNQWRGLTFVISEDVIDASVGEIFLEEIEDAIHDCLVACFGCFPHAVVDDVTCVVDDVEIGMSVTNSSQSVFNCDPWSVASLY